MPYCRHRLHPVENETSEDKLRRYAVAYNQLHRECYDKDQVIEEQESLIEQQAQLISLLKSQLGSLCGTGLGLLSHLEQGHDLSNYVN